MKSSLVAAMQQKNTTTANGALSNSSTGSAIVDFFGKGAALRKADEQEVLRYFVAAFQENQVLAIKVLFYLGDIRGGQGERRLFRLCLRWLAATNYPQCGRLIPLVPTYRRWDDVIESLDGTPYDGHAISLLVKQLDEDYNALVNSDKEYKFSLAGKWAPSEQASSPVTRRLAAKVRKAMEGMSPRMYRKMLSELRARIQVVERDMSSNHWEAINFERVPSKASLIYKDAFKRHQPERYAEYLGKVEKGEAKINAAALYPYDIVHKVFQGDDAKTLDLLWKAQPDYLKDNPHNGLVVADVSGSMSGTPMEVCISLAIYFAERNQGGFKDYFLTFSDNSKLQQVIGATLAEKVNNLQMAEWGMSTNLQSAFNAILTSAKARNIPEEEMPDAIYLISDMQFNVCVTDNSMTNYEAIKQKYEAAGYKIPRIIFWCVNAHADTPITINDKGVCLVSGCSPSILKTVLNGEVMTPLDVVLQAVNTPRYAAIEEALTQ